MIFRDNVPYYEQVKNDLLSKIKNGTYTIGQKLPSERILAEIYNVSRMTIRHSINCLTSDGYIESRPCSGTFICKPPSQPIVSLGGIVEELNRENLTTSIKMLNMEFISQTDKNMHIWRKLNCDDNEQLYKIERILYADSVPLLLDYNYFPKEIGLKFADFNISNGVIFPMLETLGYRINYAEQTISARLATTYQAQKLQISPRSPVLDFARITYGQKSTPLLFTRSIFAGLRYSYNMLLKKL